jgi:peptidoglycan/LPS O-acetylase OafA/YrhL
MSRRTPIDPLTGLRGIAAACVVLAHYSVWCAPWQSQTAPSQFYWFFNFSDEGMTLFFTLSGFVIAYNYFDFDWSKAPISSFARFIFLRFSRLYPALLVFILLIMNNVHFSRPTALEDDPAFYKWYVLHLLSLESWVPAKYGGALPVGGTFNVIWSISTEFAMYVMFAVAMIATANRARCVVAGAILGVAVGALFWSFGSLEGIGEAISPIEPLTPTDWHVWFFYSSPYFRIVDFAFGAFVGWALLHNAQLLERWRPQLRALAAASAVATILLYVAVRVFGAFPLLSEGQSPALQVLEAMLFSLIMLDGSGNSLLNRVLASRLLLSLGTMSYSLYLFHQFLPRLGMYLTTEPFSWPLLPYFAMNFALAITLAIAFSWGMYHFVEVKAQDALRQLLPRRGAAALGPQALSYPAPKLAAAISRKILAGAAVAVVVAVIGSVSLLWPSALPSHDVASSSPVPGAMAARCVRGSSVANGSNLAWPSEDLASSRYRLDNVRVEENAGLAPIGAGTANRLVETSDDGYHRVETAIDGTTPGELHTVSLFAKLGGRTALSLEMRDDRAGKYGLVGFDLRHQVPISVTGDVTKCGIERVGDDWLRVWAVMPFASDRAVVDIALLNALGSSKYLGAGEMGLFIWGVQLEPGTDPSAYLETRDGPHFGSP